MSHLNEDLNERLSDLRAQGLHRQLRPVDSPQGPHIKVGETTLLNFSSNDYLGLANHPALIEAAQKALADYGVGSGASRLICGSLSPHQQLEETLSQFKKTEASIVFSSGYAAALGTIDALLDKGDVIILDKLIHASFVDAARLSRAKLRVFAHNDLDELESILKWADQNHPWTLVGHRPRKLIVTESVFSMDGDFGALKELAYLKQKYGAWLMVDEAHATGLFGQNRRGLAEAFELADQVDIHMGTLGKAIGVSGGYICGSRVLVEFLINRARSFIFSTAPSPAVAAAATAAIRLIQSPEGELRRNQLWARVDQLKNGLIHSNWGLPPVRSSIIPIVLGDENQAVAVADQLRAAGVFIPAIRYPTVPRGTARLRVTVTAQHEPIDIAAALGAFAICKSRGVQVRAVTG